MITASDPRVTYSDLQWPQGKDIHHPPSTNYKWPLSDLPRSTLCPSLSLSFTIKYLINVYFRSAQNSSSSDSREEELLEKLKELASDSKNNGFDTEKFTELLKEYTKGR